MTWEDVFKFIIVDMEPVYEAAADSIIQILTAISQFDIRQVDPNKLTTTAQFIIDTIRIFKIIFGG